MANHGNRNVRDQQRQRVYAAENAAFPIMQVWGDTFETIHDTQAFVDKIVESAWWKKHTDIDKVVVEDGRGRRDASCLGYTYYNREYGSAMNVHGIGRIALPRGARNKNIILHELAHLVSGDWDLAAHGPEFCKAYLALVSGSWENTHITFLSMNSNGRTLPIEPIGRFNSFIKRIRRNNYVC